MAISACLLGHKPISLYHSHSYTHILGPCRPSAGRQLFHEPLLKAKHTFQNTKQLQRHSTRRHCSVAVRGKFRTHQHTQFVYTCIAQALCAGLRMLSHFLASDPAGLKQESLPSQSIKKDASRAGTGVFLLLVVNLALFAADKYFRYAICAMGVSHILLRPLRSAYSAHIFSEQQHSRLLWLQAALSVGVVLAHTQPSVVAVHNGRLLPLLLGSSLQQSLHAVHLWKDRRGGGGCWSRMAHIHSLCSW